MSNIVFYADGNRAKWSDDESNPSGITFNGVGPIDTSELSNYLSLYEREFQRLSELRNSDDEDIANSARKALNKLNIARQFKLSDFAKRLRAIK